MISKKHNFIFIHIPKAAGTSIRNALLTNLNGEVIPNEQNEGLRKWLKINYPHSWPSHATAQQISEYLNEGYKSYFKFAFIRNPLERLVSLYFYIKQTDLKILQGNVNELSKFDKIILDSNSFTSWVKKNNLGMTQQSYISVNNNIGIDYLANFHYAQSEFSYLCGKLGFSNLKLGFKNTSKHKNYTDYYDSKSLEIVREYFKKDFEIFELVKRRY